ncbi:hypothetical protein OG693_39555 (plasmid) [Streptomyces sp. NBC_01259]|uniref:hypothetical protein n=1 Tax=Streptomyces sp. NBC_01259 TaxID=2903800 RepID=UPI002F918111
MRRPALHRTRRPAASSAWAHPYPAGLFSPVFYNDGGDPPAGDPAPADPPKPAPPAQRTFTQAEVEALAAKEKAQGKRSAAKEFAEKHGFTTIEDAETFIAAARKAQDDALSEQEKQARQVAEERRTIEADKAALAAERRTVRLEQSLTRLGAIDTGDTPNLQDAMALLERELRATPDADADAITEAAERIKARRPAFFGVPTPADPAPASQLPPAPGGAPAGGAPARQTPTGKPGDRGREMARLRGHKPAA